MADHRLVSVIEAAKNPVKKFRIIYIMLNTVL